MFAVGQDLLSIFKGSLLLLVAIAFGILAVYIARSLTIRGLADPAEKDQLLNRFRELYRQGILTGDEFCAVKHRLEELRRGVPEAPADHSGDVRSF